MTGLTGAFAAVLCMAGIAVADGHGGPGGPGPGPGGPHEKRPPNYHHDRIDRPLAELALCVLYPKRCRPQPPVVVKTEPVVIIKHPVIVESPDTGKSVDVEIDDLSGYSGGWWGGLSEHSKLQFVKVYVDSHKGSESEMFKGKSYSEFVKKLNAFYKEPKNQALSVDMALDVVTLKMNGYLKFGDCMNGYYIMSASDDLFGADMINSKYDECATYNKPAGK